MTALWNRAGHYIFALWFLAFFLLLSFFLFPRLFSAVGDWMSTTWCGLSANLECRSEMCCTRGSLEIQDAKMTQQIAIWHHRTTSSGCIFATKAYIDNREKIVKQQYLLHMSEYGDFSPTNGWDPLASLGHPNKFQRVSRLRSVTARHSSSGRQPNFAALNRGRHLYSAGRPSRWALAHISSFFSHITRGHGHRESRLISDETNYTRSRTSVWDRRTYTHTYIHTATYNTAEPIYVFTEECIGLQVVIGAYLIGQKINPIFTSLVLMTLNISSSILVFSWIIACHKIVCSLLIILNIPRYTSRNPGDSASSRPTIPCAR